MVKKNSRKTGKKSSRQLKRRRWLQCFRLPVHESLSGDKNLIELECWPMPNVMAPQPNIGDALCWMLLIKSWKSRSGAIWDEKMVHHSQRRQCSNEAKTQNPLKFAGVPHSRQLISAISGPNFTILWGHVGEILLFSKFFPVVDTCVSCEDIARQSCAMVHRWQIFASNIFSELRAAHFRGAFWVCTKVTSCVEV